MKQFFAVILICLGIGMLLVQCEGEEEKCVQRVWEGGGFECTRWEPR